MRLVILLVILLDITEILLIYCWNTVGLEMIQWNHWKYVCVVL